MAPRTALLIVVFLLLMILAFSAAVGLILTQGNNDRFVITGRYQLETCPGSQNTTQVVIVDTTTGQCWVYRGGKVWNDLGSPFHAVEVPSE